MLSWLIGHFLRISLYIMSVTWCTVTDAEEQKCLDLAGNAAAKNLRGKLQCTRGLSPTDCMLKIKVSETEIMRWSPALTDSTLHIIWRFDIMDWASGLPEMWFKFLSLLNSNLVKLYNKKDMANTMLLKCWINQFTISLVNASVAKITSSVPRLIN